MKSLSDEVITEVAAKRLVGVISDMRNVVDDQRELAYSAMPENGENRSTIVYALDADIVTMFLGPNKNAFYGALFRQIYDSRASVLKKDNSEMLLFEQHISEFLSSFLLFDLQKNHPMILLHEHADDLERISARIFEKTENDLLLARHKLTVGFEKLSSAQEKIDNGNFSDSNFNEITSVIDDLYEKLNAGNLGESIRMDVIFQDGDERICHVDRFKFFDEDGNSKYIPPPFDATTGEYFSTYRNLAAKIYRQMMRSHNSGIGSKEKWIQSDAYALAQLVWVNEILSNEKYFIKVGAENVRVEKLCLITGANAIFNAIRVLDIPSLTKSVRNPLGYLCHPHTDQFDKNMLSIDERRSEHQYWGNEAMALPEFLDSLRVRFSYSGNDLSQDSGKDWEDAVNYFAKFLRFRRDFQIKTYSSRFDKFESVKKILENNQYDSLKEMLEKLLVDNYFNFARISSLIGVNEGALGDKSRRNIPPVRFENFPVAKRILGQLVALGDEVSARAAAVKIMERAFDELPKEDPSGYTEFICYSLISLVHRNLRRAESCLTYALDLISARAENLTGPLENYLNGDEAFYLLAHVTRLRAKNNDDLKVAVAFLDRARKAWHKTDAERGSRVDDDRQGNFSEVRIECEHFSIKCHQSFFADLGDAGGSKDKLDIGEAIELADALFIEVNNEPSNYIREYCIQQILVNIVQLGILCLYGASGLSGELQIFSRTELLLGAESRNKITKYAIALSDQCVRLRSGGDDFLPKVSGLAETVAEVGCGVFLGKKSIVNFDRLFKYCVSSIDRNRFAYLSKVANRL